MTVASHDVRARVAAVIDLHRSAQPGPYSDKTPATGRPGLASATKEPTAIDALWRPVGLDALTTAPPARRWLLRHPSVDWHPVDLTPGDGMLPLGKAGVLSAEGGAGKTQALVQLAVAVITGRRWLDHFVIGSDARGRGVCLALAEEDREECDRRLYDVSRAMDLTAEERELVARLLVVLPLAGVPVALLRRGLAGLEETPELAAMRRRLTDQAPPQGWALVVLDPLSRWCGPDTESDNEAATRTVQALEGFVVVPGNPTVLAAAHSSKLARRAGAVDTRGVTGITDGLRWEGQLRVQDAEVYFRQAKSNYSRPMPESQEVQLVRDSGGVLRVPSVAELDAREEEQATRGARALDADVDRVVAALEREGQASAVDAIARLAGMNLTRGRIAVRTSIDRGRIVREGSVRHPIFRVCVQRPPVPPGTSDVDVLGPKSGPGRVDGRASGRRADVERTSDVERHWTDVADTREDGAA